MQVLQRGIHCGEVLLHHCLTPLAIGLLDGFLDLLNGFFTGQNAADGKEAGLHDGVQTPSHAGLLSHLVGINGVELQMLANHIVLNFTGQMLPDFLRTVDAVEQEYAAIGCIFEDVNALEEGELVAGDEIGIAFSDEVRGANGFGSKAEVGNGDGTRFLGVIVEETLGEVIGIFTNDLD